MRMIAMSNSVAVVSTRAGAVRPSVRRIVTELLLPTTWALVTIVSGATKNPLPKPVGDSTRTRAGIARLTTSSSDESGRATEAGAAASLSRTTGAGASPFGRIVNDGAGAEGESVGASGRGGAGRLVGAAVTPAPGSGGGVCLIQKNTV